MIRFLSGFVRNTIRFDPRWGGPPPLGFVSDGWPPPGDRIPLHKTILIGGYPGNAVLKFGSKTTALDEEIVPPLTRGTLSSVHPAFNAPLLTPSSSDSLRGPSSQRGAFPIVNSGVSPSVGLSRHFVSPKENVSLSNPNDPVLTFENRTEVGFDRWPHVLTRRRRRRQSTRLRA